MDFDFITDPNFRQSLTNDFREMTNCQENGSWKAVHVLAGSIVEALLIEYLVVSKTNLSGQDPLKLDLAGAVTACVKAGVVTLQSSSLCDVIRDYRNLIHPGRAIRLKQDISPDSGRIAVSLVSIITREVAERRKLSYGPTAVQLTKKLTTDHHSLAVFPQLLSETNEHERTELVVERIPEAYKREQSFIPDDQVLERLKEAYMQTLDGLPVKTQTKVAEKFAKAIREDSADQIQAWADSFFSAKEIRLLPKRDATLVTRYLISKLDQIAPDLNLDYARSLDGIGEFLDEKETQQMADSLVKGVIKSSIDNAKRVIDLAEKIFDNIGDDGKQALMEKRIERWVALGKARAYPEIAQQRIATLASKWVTFPL